ncbi:unnamed protein product, partial [Rotaria sp. Silwood2]
PQQASKLAARPGPTNYVFGLPGPAHQICRPIRPGPGNFHGTSIIYGSGYMHSSTHS